MDTWIDPEEATPEMAPTTLEKVNTRVTELVELYEHDTQDLYALLEDAQDGENPPPPNTDTPPYHMNLESMQAMIDQALLRNSTNGDGSRSSHEDNPRNVKTTRPYFYADFMKCHPLNIKGNEGIFENQVKFATCTILDAALTWWNGQIMTLGPEAYAMTWEILKKKMTDKYCPQGELKKQETEL
nr:hypothetical protein [Tanacetum cinerariifolium]